MIKKKKKVGLRTQHFFLTALRTDWSSVLSTLVIFVWICNPGMNALGVGPHDGAHDGPHDGSHMHQTHVLAAAKSFSSWKTCSRHMVRIC